MFCDSAFEFGVGGQIGLFEKEHLPSLLHMI